MLTGLGFRLHHKLNHQKNIIMHHLNSISFTVLLPLITRSLTVDLCENGTDAIPFYRENYTQNCGCDNICVRKCCKFGFYLGKNKTCYRSSSSSERFKIPVHNEKTNLLRVVEDERHFLVGLLSCPVFLLNNSVPDDRFFVQDDGKLWVPSYNTFYENSQYCLDELDELTVFLCFDVNTKSIDTIGKSVRVTGMIISMPFLLATFLVYLFLPDINLHQKALMNYVFSLLVAYILLVSIQLSDTEFEDVVCTGLGISTIFFFIVSFLWMNVICLDIWFTFSGFRGFGGSKRESEKRRFYLYCAYAWGMAALHALIVFLINVYGDNTKDYHPQIGMKKCFVDDGWPNLYYFYGPMTVLIVLNIVLFSMTAFKIMKVKRETAMLKHNDSKRHSYEKDKQRFNLYLKLLFAMGVNWSMEIISWAVEWKLQAIPTYIWYLTDFCNAMYGVFIFFIFVFKRKVWRLLQKRYYTFIGKPHLARSMTTTTQTTRTSNYSSGNYSTADVSLNETRFNGHPNGTIPEETALTSRN